MTPRQATIALDISGPKQVQLKFAIDGEPLITEEFIPYYPNFVWDLEKRFIFQEGQAAEAKWQLDHNLSYSGTVYVRE